MQPTPPDQSQPAPGHSGPSEHSPKTAGPNRRTVLTGAGVAVVAGAVGYAAYALYGPTSTPSTPVAPPSGDAAGTELAKLADVPHDGGLILKDREIVLTRGSGDEVKGFSAVCTHQGCTVSTVTATSIECGCHGSVFDATTGAVTHGPAPSPLPPVAVSVVDGTVREG